MTNRYLTLPELKLYAAEQISSAQDDVLSDALAYAEHAVDTRCSSAFDRATETDEYPSNAWIDGNGALSIVALTRGPVASVASVAVRLPRQGWTTLAWQPDRIRIPPQSSPPSPRAWRVTIETDQRLQTGLAAGEFDCKWTYTGGYTTIPDSLKMIVARLALWKYKLREAPLGRVSVPPMGVTEVIPSIPADIGQDLSLWAKWASG